MEDNAVTNVYIVPYSLQSASHTSYTVIDGASTGYQGLCQSLYIIALTPTATPRGRHFHCQFTNWNIEVHRI